MSTDRARKKREHPQRDRAAKGVIVKPGEELQMQPVEISDIGAVVETGSRALTVKSIDGAGLFQSLPQDADKARDLTGCYITVEGVLRIVRRVQVSGHTYAVITADKAVIKGTPDA